jgi:esterase/lipase
LLTTKNALYQPSNLNSEFDSEQLSFNEYIESMRNIIAQTRKDLTPETAEKIITANSPFAFNPPQPNLAKNGVLLIHGLMDSPFSMRDMANYFLSKQFVVRSILLPGHGTVPGDLLTTSMHAWIKATAYGVAELKKEVNRVFICGLSGGAALALHHALSYQDIQGLFLFSPLIELKTRWGFLLKGIAKLGKFYERMAWVKLAAEIDYSKYESFPFYFAQQAYELSKSLQNLSLKKTLNCPMFMAVTMDDETIDSHKACEFFNKQLNSHNQLLIYGTQAASLNSLATEYRNSQFPELTILNFSHICLHIAPDNSHYGANGDFPGTLYLPKRIAHIEPDTIIYSGALTKKNLTNYCMRRLTYNPDYSYLVEKLDSFLSVF